MIEYYNRSNEEVCAGLKTDCDSGLSQKEAGIRLRKYGLNKLKDEKKKSALAILFDQLKEIMVLILLAAAAVSFALHEVVDGVVILLIVVLNTIIGFWQEYKAEKAMSALKELTVPYVRVKRGGEEQQILSEKLVPGDVMIIEAGNVISADARLIYISNLKVQESALTGESEPVEKNTAGISGEVSLGDRKNMLYMGTMVTYGRGEAIVTGTGMSSELGKIAGMLQSVEDEKTPLQKRLAKLGIILAISAAFLITIVAGISLLQGMEIKETFLTAISMAVAAIPEGLPAVVTIALAIGAKSLFRKKSLIRHLPAVETLGSVTVICSDKTGTLTQNKMTVEDLVLKDQLYKTEELKKRKKPINNDTLLLALNGAMCNDAVVTGKEMIGDPTEGALIVLNDKIGFHQKSLDAVFPRVNELPFDSERKRMTTVHEVQDTTDASLKKFLSDLDWEKGTRVAFTKGSMDGLIEISDKIFANGKISPLDDGIKKEFLDTNAKMAGQGIRVLGFCFKLLTPGDQTLEKELVFIGLTGMIDPVRPEAVSAVGDCIVAGIKPVMITGDHPLTAKAIAKQLGMADDTSRVVTGRELEKLSVEELETMVMEISVYARVSPEHKMKIIDALQDQGQIVSMTGDGVNDAPALKSADIGVAMGITGTDVSKEASDMVLLDDNFASIVAAVKEGRKIYDNIKKFLKYILTGNFGEILVMLLGPLAGLPMPLFPIQILWINLVTDGLPAIALGYEKAEKNIMQRPPYKPTESIFSRGVGRQIIMIGILTALICLGVGFYQHKTGVDEAVWRTMIFSTLTFCQMAFALAVRSNSTSIFALSPFSNKQLSVAVILTFGLQLALIYIPFMQGIFRTTALSAQQLAICIGGSFVVILAVEVEKLVLKMKKR